MVPQFFDQLNLKNSNRTVAAGGPCNWEYGDDWTEIKEVTITQGSVVGSCSTASTTVRRDKDDEWWLDASSSSQFARAVAQASAVAIVHKTDGSTEMYPWPDTVQLH